MTMTQAEMQDTIIGKANEDEDFRVRLLADPRTAIEGLTGVSIPDGFSVEVHEAGPTSFHLVLPPNRELSEQEMAQVFGGIGSWDDGHIGQT